ncbi:MAG: hypothetical protein EBX50_18190 [Chitinophagia bacterium]|nr:hypothetical protein [Chitinophagia bacterium]
MINKTKIEEEIRELADKLLGRDAPLGRLKDAHPSIDDAITAHVELDRDNPFNVGNDGSYTVRFENITYLVKDRDNWGSRPGQVHYDAQTKSITVSSMPGAQGICLAAALAKRELGVRLFIGTEKPDRNYQFPIDESEPRMLGYATAVLERTGVVGVTHLLAGNDLQEYHSSRLLYRRYLKQGLSLQAGAGPKTFLARCLSFIPAP